MLKYNFEYDKLKLKQVTLLVPKNSANLKSLLTPILGLYGLDVMGFIAHYDKITAHISIDLITPLHVTITKIKTFEVQLLTPYVGNLLNFYTNFTSKLDHNVLTIYKFFLIKSVINSTFFKPSFLAYKNIRNYLLAFNKGGKTKPNIKEIPVTFASYSDFGLIINFINANHKYINILKNLAVLFGLSIKKLNNHLIANENFKLRSNNYIIGGNCWGNFLKFFEGVNFNSTVGFLLLYVKCKSHLLRLDFFTTSFWPKFDALFLLRLFVYQYTKIQKLSTQLNVMFPRLYANLPTINQKY